MSGTVVDQQDLPVPGVRVTLTCRGRGQSMKTDARGRFVFANAPASDDCSIDVSHRGFAPLHDVVEHDAAPFVLRLRIADVKEVVDVVGRAEPRVRQSPFSVSMSDEDFRTVANTTADLIRYARSLAGATMLPLVVYVDGMPMTGLPPIETIGRITMNGSPFSAEYADGDVATVQIATKAPARTFRFRTGTDVLGLGGRNLLSSDREDESTYGNFSLTGPVAWTPLTFTLHVNGSRMSNAAPITAVVDPSATTANADTVSTVNRTGGGALDVYYAPKANRRAHVFYRESRSSGTNLGVGGLVLQESGFQSSFTSRDVRATMSGATSRLTWESGFVASGVESGMRANSADLGVSVPGNFVAGGAAVSDSRTHRLRWMAKQVIRSEATRPWSAGVAVSGSDHVNQQTPNAAGTVQFESLEGYARALAGGAVGTFFLTRGDGTVQYTNLTVAPFVQKVVVRSDHLEVSGGVRADYQRGLGTLVSPRLSLTGAWRGWTVAAGAGLFVRSVPEAVYLGAIANDGRHLQSSMATGFTFDRTTDAGMDRLASLRSNLGADLTPPREWMEKLSVERRFGRFAPGIDYTWTQSRRLLGSTRVPDGADWVDVVESDRAANRHRLHAQLRYTWKRQTIAGHYEWTHARDNTDGPFSYPEQSGDLAAEWARSAGLPPHNVSAAASFSLPLAISVSVTEMWNAGAPYNVTTGLDAAGNGLHVDRGGRARNSGDGPGFHTLSLYGYRRLPLPGALGRGRARLHLNLGVQADNILDHTNYLSVGSIAGASSFGRPLAAMPGRSVRLLLNID